MKNFQVYDSILKDTFDIVIGTSAEENWQIIDGASNEDIWFHLDEYSSSHVILNTKNLKLKDFNKQTFIHCASLCKQHSKYKNTKNIEIIYTQIKNIKKGNTIGSVEIIGSSKKLKIT
jgi:predicted ribosome quality control (RQC) complex YloA/Tae2 family protein